MRPATARIRNRSRLGSHRRAGSCSVQARTWVQASRSAARATSSSQIWLWAKPWNGRLRRPVSLRPRMRSSAAGALAVSDLEVGQGPAGAAGVGGEAGDPPAVVVGQPQLRARMRAFSAGDDPHPRAIAAVAGRARVDGRAGIQPVSSATWAPSRGSPSDRARHATPASGIASIAALTVSWAWNPTEYCSPSVGDVVQEHLRTRRRCRRGPAPGRARARAAEPARRPASRCGRRCSMGRPFPAADPSSAVSPVPCSPWSTNAHIGANPNPRLERRLGTLLVRVRSHQRGIDIDDHLTVGPAARHRPASGRRCDHSTARAGARALPDRADRGVDVRSEGRDQP